MATDHATAWHDALGRWRIPDHILAAAPGDPYRLSPGTFAAHARRALREPPTRTHRRAAAALPDGGSVLDVGCGGGAGSLPLAGRAGLLVGADQGEQMLAAFADAAACLGVRALTVEGVWPRDADRAPVADVVVCVHVVYNVADLGALVTALTGHARHRVVLELPAQHPRAWLAPYWRALHDLDRPERPTADDALAVVAEAGHDVHHERWERPFSLRDAPHAEQVDLVATSVAVGADRRDEVARLVADIGVPATRAVVTAWWDV